MKKKEKLKIKVEKMKMKIFNFLYEIFTNSKIRNVLIIKCALMLVLIHASFMTSSMNIHDVLNVASM